MGIFLPFSDSARVVGFGAGRPQRLSATTLTPGYMICHSQHLITTARVDLDPLGRWWVSVSFLHC